MVHVRHVDGACMQRVITTSNARVTGAVTPLKYSGKQNTSDDISSNAVVANINNGHFSPCEMNGRCLTQPTTIHPDTDKHTAT